MTAKKAVSAKVKSFHSENEAQISKTWKDNKHFLSPNKKAAKTIISQAVFCNQSEAFNINHCRNLIISDVITRYQRMHGNNVRLQLGLDQFGAGVHATSNNLNQSPNDYLKQAKTQLLTSLARLGLATDLNEIIETNSQQHIKWIQEIFLLFWNAKPSFVNPEKQHGINYWDPGSHSNISLRQIVNGRGPHSGMLIEIKEVSTYEVPVKNFLCEKLLNGLEKLHNWDVFVKNMQRESIGLEDGIIINFDLFSSNNQNLAPLAVFTSRADTILGTTFIAIAADHPLAKKIASTNNQIKEFCTTVTKPDYAYQRLGEDKSQDGIPLGVYAINPINGDHLPIWVTNYVVASYGTGATLGVPGHDQRNFNFAQRHNLTMRRVLSDDINNTSNVIKEPYISKEGVVINSAKLGEAINRCKKTLLSKQAKAKTNLHDKRSWDQAINKTVLAYLKEHQVDAKAVVMTRLRGWKISQEDYWGYPIPLIHCDKCGTVAVNKKDLPLTLPKFVEGKDKLADYPSFVNCKCPKCKQNAKRETDTLGSVFDSAINHLSAYKNHKLRKDESNNSFYCCGVEHATNHLLTSRISSHILASIYPKDKLSTEPFANLVSQGSVLNYGLPMTTGYGNAIEVASLLDEYGADSLRLYLATAVDSRHPLNWDENKLFSLHGYIDVKDYRNLQTKKLSKNKLAVIQRVLSLREIDRLQNGLLNKEEFRLLKQNKLPTNKLKQVMKIIDADDLTSLQNGIFDVSQMRRLRKNTLSTSEQKQLESILTANEINRLQHGLLDQNEFQQLLNNNLPKQKLAQVARCIPAEVIKKLQAKKFDLHQKDTVAKIQEEYLDRYENEHQEHLAYYLDLLKKARLVLADEEIQKMKSTKRILTNKQQELNKVLNGREQKDLFLNLNKPKYSQPLLRFIDKSRMINVKNYIDEIKLDKLVNFIDDHRLEELLGFVGSLYLIINDQKNMINPKLAKFNYRDQRRGQIHQILRAINACFEFQDPSTKKVNINRNLELHRLLAKVKELINLLTNSANSNPTTDEAFVTETTRIILQVLHPIIPHITDKLWQELGFKDLLINTDWPVVDKKALQEQKHKLFIQENGKKRLVVELDKIHSLGQLRNIAANNLRLYYQNRAYPKYPTIGYKLKSVEIAKQHLDYVANFVLSKTEQ